MKFSEHKEALQLRRQGISYDNIGKRLGIAKSTLWRWLKTEGLVETQPQRLTELKRIAQRKGAAVNRAKRILRTRAIVEQAKRDVTHFSKRDLWLIGVALYWAEGTKQKPHNVAQRVVFTNSDPAMLLFFLRWLRTICHVPTEQLTFELCIHDTSNVEAARRFWSSTLQIPADRLRIRLKRHKRVPHRRNIGDGYVGLVRITVARSAQLNRRIAGWIAGLCQRVGESANGKPPDFGSGYPGSIPGSPVFRLETGVEGNRDSKSGRSDRLREDRLPRERLAATGTTRQRSVAGSGGADSWLPSF